MFGELTELLLVAMEVIIVVLGLTISVIAFLGYRKHGSRPMLFVSLGFVLLVGVPAILTVLLFVTPLLDQEMMILLNRGATVVGMASILYGLWVDPE